ncbi:hypothetical protein OG729_00670 [Streptomyces sp. NBC_00210]|uniref:hypothetical protein n=1 Tax=unclassified Streptomyces TaxID=2593676 RepID=UPI003254BD37
MAKRRRTRPITPKPVPRPTLLWREVSRRATLGLAAAAGPAALALIQWWTHTH